MTTNDRPLLRLQRVGSAGCDDRGEDHRVPWPFDFDLPNFRFLNGRIPNRKPGGCETYGYDRQQR